jgi:hypothetical protein
MSSSAIDTLNFISIKVYIYGYCCVFILGVFSNSINILLFSTKTYRTNPCSLYFIITEMSNLINLLINLLPRIVGLITGKNGTETYLWWCKLMNYLGDANFTVSIMTLCLASIDRYHSTSRNVQRRQRSSMKIAKISISIAIVVSYLLTSPDTYYWVIDSSYGEPMCMILSFVYYYYTNFFLSPVVFTFGPLILLSIFGILTYRNIKSIQRVNPINRISTTNLATATFAVSRISGAANDDENVHVNLGQHQNQTKKKIANNRQRIDRQFSTILILQILWFGVTIIPACIYFIYARATAKFVKSDMTQAIEGLVASITFVIACMPFCANFYIYYLSSSAYRQNIKKMLCKKNHI